mmetsp:Transcript_20413/g.51874  ORF Transcript_20413/g.51874 Transcript_20413/m.51874 type:complete len:1342 (-) Transcript_20413:218-4243(-)
MMIKLARARRGTVEPPSSIQAGDVSFRERSATTRVEVRDRRESREGSSVSERKDSAGTRQQKLQRTMAAADDAPMMIVCYSRDDALITYINKEVFRVLGPDVEVGKSVECILDGKFRSERSVESCLQLFGIGEMVETKKSAMELRSAANNALPAMFVMRASSNGRDCTATLFPGHAFQADFLEWQTAKTYRSSNANPSAGRGSGGPAMSISDFGTTAHVGQLVKPIFVEMDTLRKVARDDKVEWREVAHWKDGLEQSVAEGKRGEMQFGRAHLSTVKFHDFLLLRKLITRGTVMIDLEVDPLATSASALHFIASAIVNDMVASGALDDENRDEAMQVIQAQHLHATERRKRKLDDTRKGTAGLVRRPSAQFVLPTDESQSQHAPSFAPSVAPSIIPPSFSEPAGNGRAGSEEDVSGSTAPASLLSRVDSWPGTYPPIAPAATPISTTAVKLTPLASKLTPLTGSRLTPLSARASMNGPPMLGRATSRERNVPVELREAEDEACDVLAGTVSFLDEQAAVFVRLKRAVDLGTFTEHEDGVKPPPVRFVFIVLGPLSCQHDNDHVGHAIACMMSSAAFAAKAQVLASKDDLLETIDGSIDQTNLTFAHNIEAMRERDHNNDNDNDVSCGGCCSWFNPGGFPEDREAFGGMDRKGYSAVTVVEVSVSAVPATSSVYEVKAFERPTHVRKLKRLDAFPALAMVVVAVFCACLLVFWRPIEARTDVVSARLHRMQTSITSPLYAPRNDRPLLLELAATPRSVVDIKMLAACTSLDCPSELKRAAQRKAERGLAGRRRLQAERAKEERRRLAVVAGGGTLDGATYVEWTLWAGGERCASERVFLRVDIHAEDWATVDVETSQCAAEAAAGQVLRLRVTTDASDGLPLLIQATQMGAVGRQRRVLGGLLLGLSFVAFHVEWMHRVYTSFVVALCAIGLLSLCSSAPTLTAVVSMVDASTVALTFAMSVNTHLLMLTGFFEWASGYAIRMSGGSVAKIFFLLTNLAGVLSLLLDNVTCVLLLGPISIKLCEQLGVNPLPLYLTQTLAATIGGTATLLGDPLNVLIGNKLDLSFDSFCVYNGPLMLVAMPVATAVQYYRLKHTLGAERVALDLPRMKADLRIHDELSLAYLAAIFLGIFLGLVLSDLHGHEAAWFCVLGMLGAAITTSRRDVRHAIGAVEWDALLFFCGLFVFVGSLEELGLVRAIGTGFAEGINRLPAESQLPVALVAVLWISAIGSAFLESLPFTMVITYVLHGINSEGVLLAQVGPLTWALSVGACVGGIGSLKGSSANLACVGVSARYAPSNPIKGHHFLRYGFPLLLLIISVATAYQHVVFVYIASPYSISTVSR